MLRQSEKIQKQVAMSSRFLAWALYVCGSAALLTACGGGGGGSSSGPMMMITPPGSEPDLVVELLPVSDSSPDAGASFTLSATVSNSGAGRSAATTLRYYRSSDATITASDTEEGMNAVGALSASGTSAESISLTAPSSAGTYYYGACVDTVSGESNTANNCSSAVTVTVSAGSTKPDLMVELSLVGDSSPAAGASFTLSATVSNRGNGRSAATTLRYYRSSDATITASDTEEGMNAVGALSASGTSAESISLTAPSSAGTYYYGACVDTVSGESNTANNCSSAVTVTVSAGSTKPDLAVESPSVDDSSPAAGASFTLNATVSNRGNGRSAATTLRYYRSSDATITASDTEEGMDAVGALSASGTSAESISLTAPSSAGTYYYGACVDTVSGESNTANNCSSAVTVTVSAGSTKPDLVVELSLVDDSSPAAGASFTLSATVSNSGAGQSEATTLRYYRSSDATITASDTEEGMNAVGALSASGTSAESISLTAPSSAGTYYYGACVDTVSGESNTANNCSSAVTVTVSAGSTKPDLVVELSLVGDSSPAAGAEFILRATVRNRGSGYSPPTTLRYYHSLDETISTSDTEVGTKDSVSAIAVDTSAVESIRLLAPPTAGTYYYGACVEAVSGESDKTNNCSSAVTVTVSTQPDLVVELLPVSDSSPAAGTTFTLSATVRNRGSGQSEATTLRYYRSSNLTISRSDTAVGTDAVDALAALGTSAESIILPAPSTAGPYYYGACVDTVSGESNTENNCSSAVSVSASQPDLAVGRPSVSDSSPDKGASFTLSATVSNSGNGRSAATTLHYYRSSDETITALDTEVGMNAVGSLAASATSPQSISLIAPSSAGPYYYGACVEAVSGESDTTNNCSTAERVTVSAGGGGNSFEVGDALPGVPTSGSFFVPAEVTGVVNLARFGGTTTITFGNGAVMELQDGTVYTCRASVAVVGCRVINGVVTEGTIVRSSG